jgi:hypothetical protein
MKHLVALTFVCLGAPCWAQSAPASSAAAQATERGEPNVKYTLIEDEGSKIDELRVRGQLQHVIVTPKVGFTKRYEIIVSRSGRDPVDGTGGANGALGKRVWNVLDF